jgi:hypothetical protein
VRCVEARRRRTDRVEDYGGVLPPWFGESGEGRQRKRANLGKEKCGKFIGELTVWGVGTIAIAEAIVRCGGAVNGEGGVSYTLTQQGPGFGKPGANSRGRRQRVQIVIVHPNGDVAGEQDERPWGDEGGREERLA